MIFLTTKEIINESEKQIKREGDFSKMAAEILSIEVGERYLKVCAATKSGANSLPKIRNGFKILIPQGSITDGQINNPQELAALIAPRLKENRMDSIKTAAFSISSSRVANRVLTFPNVKESRVKSLVELNAQEHFPVDLSSYRVAHDVLGVDTQDGSQSMRVLVTIAPGTIVSSYVRLAEALKVRPISIDVSANGQYQALKSIKAPGLTMYVNVGIQYTTVTFLNVDKLVLQRVFPIGGSELLNAVINSGAAPEDDYDKLMTFCADGSSVASAITAEQATVYINRMSDGISRANDFLKTSYKGQSTDNIVLFGDCSRFAGLKEAVASLTGIKTEYFSDSELFAKVDQSIRTASEFIGIVGSVKAPLDLMPVSSGKKKPSDQSTTAALITPILFFIVALGIGGYFAYDSYMQDQKALDELATIEARIAEIEFSEQIHNTHIEYIAAEQNMQEFVAQYDNSNKYLVNFFEELEEKMPENLLVLTANCTTQQITLNVTMETYEDAILTISQLRTFDTIDTIAVSAISKQLSDAGEYVGFTLTANYKTVSETGEEE